MEHAPELPVLVPHHKGRKRFHLGELILRGSVLCHPVLVPGTSCYNFLQYWLQCSGKCVVRG